MLKRILSFLLCLAMVLSIVPAQAISTHAEETLSEGLFYLQWVQDGEILDWDSTCAVEDLPAGVTYDPDKTEMTLNGAELALLKVENYGDQAVSLVVEGENTINGGADTLRITNCHAVTVSGSGTLNLIGEDDPFNWHDYMGDDPTAYNTDGSMTISGVTLNCTNTRTVPPEGATEDDWSWFAPMSLGGGNIHITGKAKITAEGLGFIGVYGKLVVDGGAEINGTGMHLNVWCWDSSTDTAAPFCAPSVTVAQDGTINLKRTGTALGNHGMVWISANSSLILDGGILNIEEFSPDDYGNVMLCGDVADTAPGGAIVINSGELNLSGGSNADCGIGIGRGASYRQTGGDVTVTVDLTGAADYRSLQIAPDASFSLNGGSLKLVNTGGEVAQDAYVTAVHLDKYSAGAAITGGTLTTEGEWSRDLILDGKMMISGGEVNFGSAEMFMHGADMMILGGTVNADVIVPRWGGSFQMLGGTMNVGEFVNEGAYSRFMGGETTVTTYYRVCFPDNNDPYAAISYGEGMAALYADNGDSVVFADETGGNGESGVWVSEFKRPVSIRHQGAAAPGFTALMELTNGRILTAGTVGAIRLTASLTTPTGTVSVALPEGLRLQAGSVTVNDRVAAYTETETGFDVTIASGEIIRFGVIAAAAGEYTITAGSGGASVFLDVTATDFSLSIPTSTNKSSLSISGTAVPGAVLTFYVNGKENQTATANALGNWKAALNLSEGEGTYTVYADVLSDGMTTRSEMYSLRYDDTSPVVETLTVTNTIHGNTEADPNRDVSLEINYLTGKKSRNYYIYWPELPDFHFAVKFQNHSGTPDTVSDVAVVVTDYFGVEETVALAYDADSGLWKGTAQFCGEGDIVPENFRVEWNTLGAEREEEPEETQATEPSEPYIPEPVENNYTEDAIVTAESLTYTFLLSEDAEGLAVTDGFGTPVTVTDNTITGESGNRYYATLTGGSFTDFDTRSLCVLMPATGAYSYDLDENVHTEAGTGYSVGDVVINGDIAQVITGINDDGSYVYGDAALEDVFANLTVDGLAAVEGEAVILDGDMEAAVTQAFLGTNVYAAYTDALDDYAEAKQLNAFEAPKITTKLTYGLEFKDHKYILTITPEITVTSKGIAKTPDDSVDTTITGKFSYEIKEIFDFRIDMKDKEFQGAAFTHDYTNTFTLSIAASINGTDSTAVAGEMEEYFSEELNKEGKKKQEYLESLTDPEAKKGEAPIGSMKIRTNIPFLYIEVALDLEIYHEFSGSASINGTVSFGYISGFVITGDKQIRPFFQYKELYAKAWAEFHVESKTGVNLKLSAGPKLLNLMSLQVEATMGPAIKAGGHGEAAISTKPSEQGASAEFWIGETIDVNVGIRGEARFVGKTLAVDIKIFEYSYPLGFTGTDKMPFKFTTVEEETNVYRDCVVTDIISHELDYQTFSNGLKTQSEVLEMENYDYYFESTQYFTVSEGKIKVLQPDRECEDWLYLTYNVPSGSYQVTKLIKIKYSPAQIVIHKTTEDGGPMTAGFSIQNQETGEVVASVSTNGAGLAAVSVAANKTYTVSEVSCPGGYVCDEPVKTVQVGNEEAHVSFFNRKEEEEEPEEPTDKTPDVKVPGNGDPSGYVFEGIESNRLEGVTVTLYRSDAESGAEAASWNAADFDQMNPLTSDEWGQYLWMVPSGWYQVRYSLEGYDPESTGWMVVPPIRTGVNQAMTSYAPAAFTLTYSEEMEALVLRFSRPVMVSALGLAMTVNGNGADAWFAPLDADWSAMEDPADSTVCATTFLMYVDGELSGASVELTVDSVTYAGVGATGTATVTLPEIQQPPHDHTDAPDDGDHICDTCQAPDVSAHTGGTATCMAKAVCSDCGAEYGEKDSANHTGVNHIEGAAQATCGEAGYTGDTVCECGETVSAGAEIPASGNHTDGSDDGDHSCDVCRAFDVSAHTGGTATCMAKAVCSDCGAEYGEKNPQNHTGVNHIEGAAQATCGEAGYTGDTVCECGATVSAGEAIPATGNHVYAAEVAGTRTPATCVATGSVTMACSCGATQVQSLEIDRENHTGVNHTEGAVAESCGRAGYTGDTVCECGTVVAQGRTIPATGDHSDTAADGNHACDVCGAENVSSHTGGTATCMAKAVCSDCNTEYGARNPQNHTGVNHTENAREATCGAAGYTGDSVCECGVKIGDGQTIPATGNHSDGAGDGNHACDVCGAEQVSSHTGGTATCMAKAVCSECGAEYGEKNPQNHTGVNHIEGAAEATCTAEGYTGDTYCECGVKIAAGEAIPVTEHDYVDGECADCGAEDPDWEDPTEPTEPEPTEPEVPEIQGVIRLAGKSRYETGFAIAGKLKELKGIEKFSAVIVAYGQNFPDALTGSYLAAVKNAPILLTEPSADANLLSYLKENLVSGGKIYILGGTAAVSQSFENSARSRGFNVQRLKGAGRYETNLEILKEAGVNTTDEVLIATGKNYADSLSASATGLPMLLVDKNLTASQKAFLENTSKKFVILGGTGAVSAEVEAELDAIGDVTRVKGASRYGTSVEIAKRYFTAPSAAVLAYAEGFPDGLCGGPLAYCIGTPLILTSNTSSALADEYVEGITSGAVTGGTGRITDETVRDIFDLPADTPIVKP